MMTLTRKNLLFIDYSEDGEVTAICGKCHRKGKSTMVMPHYKHCPECGKKLKWGKYLRG